MDGWQLVKECGVDYWRFWDNGLPLFTVCEKCRDEILLKSGLPLKIVVNSDEL
jgi:hypothetical protein